MMLRMGLGIFSSSKTVNNPMWVFPAPVHEMLKGSFQSLAGKRVLVPSSGNNVAVFAFHLLGAKVTSSDFAENQLKNAKSIADRHSWNIEFVCDDNMGLSNKRGDLGHYWDWREGDAYLSAGAITSDIADMLSYAQMQFDGSDYMKQCHESLRVINASNSSYKAMGIKLLQSQQ